MTDQRPADRFLVDGMHGTLATKLRILGFDTLYDKKSADEELMTLAQSENRILVTSDIQLYLRSKRKHIRSQLLTSSSDETRLVELLGSLGFTSLGPPKISRCSKCNGPLSTAGTELTESKAGGRKIYTCDDCHKAFWKGSHWKKLDALFSRVDYKLRRERA